MSGLDEMHSAVRAFERNVSWAVQSESRGKRAGRSKVRPPQLFTPGLSQCIMCLCLLVCLVALLAA